MSDLLKINVNEHTERKNNLTYLSWVWAWAEVLKIDPQAKHEVHEFNGLPACFLPDTSAMVKVSVTIKGDTKTCHLPVMDHKNKAIKGPDAFAINTAIVRCMTKAIALHGLGLYIYAGEDLPEAEQPSQEQQRRESELQELAMLIVDHAENGRELKAAELYYAIPDNEEKIYVWGLMKPHSAIRAAIKKLSPHKDAA